MSHQEHNQPAPSFEDRIGSAVVLANHAYRNIGIFPAPYITGIQSVMRRPGPGALDRAATRLGNEIDATAAMQQEELAESGLADKMLADHAQLDASSVVLASVGLAATVDEVKKKTLGVKASTAASNALTMRSIEYAGWNFAERNYSHMGSKREKALGSMATLKNILLADERQGVAWTAPKVGELETSARNSFGILSMYEAMPERLSKRETEELRTDNDQLFKELIALRKYGVKPAIAPGNEDSPVDEWLVMRPGVFKTSENDPLRYTNSRMLATFGAVKGARFNSSVAVETAVHASHHKDVKFSSYGFSVADRDPDYVATLFQLGDDGEVYLEAGGNLRRLSAEVDQRDSYEMIRSEVLSIYYDLVVPVEVQALTDQEAAATAPTSEETAPESVAGKLRRLVLARKRVLETMGEEVEAALKNEEEAMQEQERNARNLAEHDVVGHIRKIPSTYRASSESRALCKRDLGMVLADFGETYVRDHKRGNRSEDGPKGHRATFAQGAVASQRTHGRRSRGGGRYTAPQSK
jgi:hypothetical protein